MLAAGGRFGPAGAPHAASPPFAFVIWRLPSQLILYWSMLDLNHIYAYIGVGVVQTGEVTLVRRRQAVSAISNWVQEDRFIRHISCWLCHHGPVMVSGLHFPWARPEGSNKV